MKAAALFALLALAAAEDLSPVDNVRKNFYALEVEMWNNVSDPLWRESGLGGDVELTKAFVVLDNQISSIPRPPRPPLSSWLWLKATEKLQIIDGLYKSFVDFARRQSAPGAVPAPVKDWLDLAESILMDPKTSAMQAVRKLQGLLQHGDLFRSILQVHKQRMRPICRAGRNDPGFMLSESEGRSIDLRNVNKVRLGVWQAVCQ